MASWMYISVCIIAALVLDTVTGVTLSITTPIDIGGQGGQSSGNNQMTVSCSHTGANVYVMGIGKLDQNNQKQAIVRVTPPNLDTVEVVETSLQQRMTQISGSTSSGSLQFTLSDLVCTDAGRYYCSMTYGSAGGASETDEDLKNVTARTQPGVITMNVYQDKLQYDVGDLIEFNCNGLIGNQFNENNLAGFWQWDWGSIDQSWTSYPNPNNITYETPTSAGNCQYNGRSRLFHTVTSFDNGRRFRCYVLNNAVNASEKTVYTQNPGVTGNPGGVGDGPAEASNLGPILGGVFAALIVIIIIVVLVYIFVFRRKSGGDDYDTGEGKDERPPMTDNVVYSTPASRDNKPSRMKGRENDALDEPQEKNPRAYYANDYGNDRGRSNPAMDEDSKHNRSYDDDNTDSRMRPHYGSAV